MKLFILISILLVAGHGFAQRPAKPTKARPKPIVTPVREKFDPKRDPAKDLKAAIVTAETTGKRIILDVGGEWCGWCVEMGNFFLKNPALLKIRNQDFVWVKVNMSSENENAVFLSKYPPIEGYPHLFVLESDGTLLASQDTADLEEPTPEPVVLKRNVSGQPILVDLGSSSYDLYEMVEFFRKWRKKK